MARVQKVKGKKMASWIARWDVVGSRGDPWVVSMKADGSFGCSCPGWKFHKAPKPDCRHIRAMKACNVEVVPSPPASFTIAWSPEPPSPEPPPQVLEQSAEVAGEVFRVRRKFKLEELDA